MPGIPQNILDDIVNRVDIVEVISGYIPLKKAGRNFKALCPFHHEKTPSFMVSPDRQIYHCFGCGAGGNVFNFLMRYERIEFPEAVQILAKKAGVNLPRFQPEQAQRQEALTTQLYKINALAAEFYSRCLASEAGAKARVYLHRRGIGEEAIRQFRLGFAPAGRDALLNFLRSRGISISLIEKAGLILKKEVGVGFYDRFRNRIIFPICEIKGRIVGFGGRLLDGERLAKYVNSPETLLYVKGKNLFGLNVSKESIRVCDSVAIVEGYLDFITPYINGFTNIVASLGTALTIDQIRLLKRYTSNVIMVYDADRAGEEATLRSLDLLIEEDLNVKVACLGEGLDPDAFIRKNNIEAFRKKIDAAVPLFDYKLKILNERYDSNVIEDRAKIAKEMLISINRFRNEIIKSEYIKRLAYELKIKEDSLRLELTKIKNGEINRRPFGFGFDNSATSAAMNPLEKMLVRLALDEKRFLLRLKEHLAPSDFQDKRLSRLVGIMFELADRNEDVCAFRVINHCPDSSLAEVVSELAAADLDIQFQDKEKILTDCISRLRNERIKSRCVAIQEEIRIAENSRDEERVVQLMEELRMLTKSGALK